MAGYYNRSIDEGSNSTHALAPQPSTVSTLSSTVYSSVETEQPDKYNDMSSRMWVYKPTGAASQQQQRDAGYFENDDAITQTDIEEVEEEIELEAMRLMGGQDGANDGKVKMVAAKIRAILEDKLADRGVVGRFAPDIVERKLQSIVGKIKTGSADVKTAIREARLWQSVLEFADSRKGLPEFENEDVCSNETEEISAYAQPVELERRLPLGDAMAGITYRDQYYEEIAFDHNSRLGMNLGPKIDEFNKKRALVNDLVDEHNFLMDQMPIEKTLLEKKKAEFEVKAKEWEEMQASYSRWPEEKEELLEQLDVLHEELLEAEAENAKINTLVESLQASVGRHQDALQILKSMPSDVQEYYKKILAFSNEIAEANDKIDELKGTYWDFIGIVEKLSDSLLKMEMIPAVSLFMAENFQKSFVQAPWREAGLKPGRLPAVHNKVANSVRMAKRLSVLLERARKNEKRVLKGLTF